MTRPTLATVGDNCIDHFLPPIGRTLVGGNAVNVAVQLARLGRRVGYFGAVGSDAEGARTKAVLAAQGVDITAVRVRDGVTGFTRIAVDASGDRHFVEEQYGVSVGYHPDAADMLQLKRLQHVHLGWLSDAAPLKRDLVAAGVSLSQDYAVNQASGALAVMFASVGPSPDAAEALAVRLLAQGARLAVVTMGEAGSLASDGRGFARTGIRAVSVTDTTGAGDSFIAGFIDAHLKGLSLQACLDHGRDRAAETCRHYGGFPQPDDAAGVVPPD